MGISEVIRATLRVLDLVEVRGKNNRNALDVVVSNLEAIIEALEKSKEAKPNDADDGQGQDV